MDKDSFWRSGANLRPCFKRVYESSSRNSALWTLRQRLGEPEHARKGLCLASQTGRAEVEAGGKASMGLRWTSDGLRAAMALFHWLFVRWAAGSSLVGPGAVGSYQGGGGGRRFGGFAQVTQPPVGFFLGGSSIRSLGFMFDRGQEGHQTRAFLMWPALRRYEWPLLTGAAAAEWFQPQIHVLLSRPGAFS